MNAGSAGILAGTRRVFGTGKAGRDAGVLGGGRPTGVVHGLSTVPADAKAQR
jgi:hypothetical protein